MSIINNPELPGDSCGFEYDGLNTYFESESTLPQFIQSYFLRFDYEGSCAGTPFTFTPNFNPTPDSICWTFGDPASGAADTSNLLNPTHVFTQGGGYTVNAFVRYPGGRTEQTSRFVRVAHLPAPNLGPDVTVCKGTSVALDPGSFVSYTWSNGAAGQNISVADTGLYWVEVVNDTGCINRDTIRVNWFPSPVPDESLLNIAPTTCGDSTGAITGLTVSGIPPVSLSWKNSSGTVLGSSPDLYHLPVDNYTLWVTDGAGCSTPVKTYTIRNVGDTLILSVDRSHSHCSLANGSVTVHATAGLTTMLQYSLNGTDWFTNGGTFSGLAPGSYNVWVRDSLGCMKVYDGNPVVVSSIPGPAVQPPVVVPETGGQSNGSITLTATSAGDTLWYSLNGSAPQLNNGTFQNLAAGNYSITITDEYGCDTTLMVTLSNLPLIHLQAIAGDGTACLGNIAVIPLTANNFTGVQSFQAVVYYDPSIVTCQNYLNPHDLLRDSISVDVIPALGQVNISWKGNQPVTLANGSSLLELAFASVIPGNSQIVWDAYPGRCVFVDSIGSNIPAELTPGQVKVFSIPKADVSDPKAVCEGSDLLIMPMYQTGTGNGTITWNWTGPNSFASDKQLVYFPVTTAEQSGTYTLTLTDTNQCISIYHINATITPTPKATFHGQDTLYLEPGSALDAGSGYDSYRWNTGDSTQRIITGSEGWYAVTLKAGKCTATDSVYITTPYAPLYLPTAFTPNGDGLNDVFRPVTNPDQISSYSLQIYDKWGGLIFESRNPQAGWDGRCGASAGSAASALAPVGVYTYIVKYGSRSAAFSKKERVIRGMVTVVR